MLFRYSNGLDADRRNYLEVHMQLEVRVDLSAHEEESTRLTVHIVFFL